jgi:hypothetical protein
MPFVERDDVVQQLAPTTSHPAFRDSGRNTPRAPADRCHCRRSRIRRSAQAFPDSRRRKGR